MDSSLLNSSLTLLAMGCSVLVVSIIFRLKSRAIDSLPKNLSANVFDKTFIVFNPYQEQRKIIHSLLLAIPIVVLFFSIGLLLIVWKILEYGLLVSLLILLIGLNLMALESMFEVYQNSKIFIKAVQGGTSLGVGDLKVFHMIKKLVPKLSNYYLGLSILFIVSSVMLPYIWSSALWFFARFIGLILEVSAPTGVISYPVVVFLFALTLVVIQLFASAAKKKLLSDVMGF